MTALGAAVIAVALGLVITAHMSGLVADALVSRHKQVTVSSLSEARARIEGRMHEALAIGQGVKAYVSQHPVMSQDDFDFLAALFVDSNKTIRSIGVAPGNRLEYVFPIAGNEKAIGIYYPTVENQWPEIKQAIDSREPVVSGPLNLVQGGRALMVRIPIFIPGHVQEEAGVWPYWGMVTLVVDELVLLSMAGIDKLSSEYDVAVYARDDVKPYPILISGDSAVLENKEAVELPIDISRGKNWVIRAIPKTGWIPKGEELALSRLIGFSLSFLFGAMVFLLVLEFKKVKALALHDALTGLPNRRLLEERMEQLAVMEQRTGSGFEIFYIDLDGFKRVNDTNGHMVGDLLLREIGDRLCDFVRATDTVARIGGDEFIIMAPGIMTTENRRRFLDQLDAHLDEAITIRKYVLDVRASIGCATYPNDTQDVTELIRVADARMYLEKSRRRVGSNDDGFEDHDSQFSRLAKLSIR